MHVFGKSSLKAEYRCESRCWWAVCREEADGAPGLSLVVDWSCHRRHLQKQMLSSSRGLFSKQTRISLPCFTPRTGNSVNSVNSFIPCRTFSSQLLLLVVVAVEKCEFPGSTLWKTGGSRGKAISPFDLLKDLQEERPAGSHTRSHSFLSLQQLPGSGRPSNIWPHRGLERKPRWLAHLSG